MSKAPNLPTERSNKQKRRMIEHKTHGSKFSPKILESNPEVTKVTVATMIHIVPTETKKKIQIGNLPSVSYPSNKDLPV
jgi:hypothetical protein